MEMREAQNDAKNGNLSNIEMNHLKPPLTQLVQPQPSMKPVTPVQTKRNSKRLAVHIDSGFKKYGTFPVLTNLNIKIRENTM